MTTKETPPPAEKPADPLDGLVRGRKVYYWPHPHEARAADPGPWPATVTNISTEVAGVVTLNVDMPEPTMVGTDPVARIRGVGFSAEKLPGHWSWMR